MDEHLDQEKAEALSKQLSVTAERLGSELQKLVNTAFYHFTLPELENFVAYAQAEMTGQIPSSPENMSEAEMAQYRRNLAHLQWMGLRLMELHGMMPAVPKAN